MFGVVVLIPVLVFLFAQCGSKEETGEKEKKATAAVNVQKEGVKAKMKKDKSVLPKRLLAAGLTDEQVAACETVYNEIFTPEVLAKRNELYKQLRALEKDSEDYKKLRGEISETFKPYNKQFRQKIRKILTKEQKEKYFKKPAKKEEKTETKTN
jgi:hypothetical protein